MPVTAKLSRTFYERLGDEIANELVEWFNLVDATYRSDLRELNELNFARFRSEMEAGFAKADAKLEQRLAELRAEMHAGFTQLEARLTRRLFAFWIAQTATTVGLVLAVVRLTGR